MNFYRRGEQAARFDVEHDQFCDVPACLTSMYSSSPSIIEMEHYGEGYLETGLKLGVPPSVVRRERERFLNFLNGRGCETHFFGKWDPKKEDL